eukprot:CAMPEP_0194181604 /NCGR_PEP_ID=MMETSP0154-20130528/20704_1 /TAXON_ID=1049557 /ORGANISM="Thalassiothrix antarctica, Strain L6-D1" /LENGTH=111 /DNA_ID=CAMNT_0038897629 /DNA_START=200 /DNA_END=535 /DNA_ORIENTATION=-
MADIRSAEVTEAEGIVVDLLKAGDHAGLAMTIPGIEFFAIGAMQLKTDQGVTYKLTLEMKDGDSCIGAFDVDVDHFSGQYNITKWGEGYDCEQARSIERDYATPFSNSTAE